MSGAYVEDPIMRIVDVHWKKKKPDEPPGADIDDRWCATPYGWGAEYIGGPGGGGPRIPRGPFQLPPFVGTFTLGSAGVYPPKGDYINYGGLNRLPPGASPSDTHTAGPYIDLAEFLYIDWSHIEFQTAWTQSLGTTPVANWTIGMSGGDFLPEFPSWTVLNYEFDFEWDGGELDGEVGIGISHPRDDGHGMTIPTTPAAVLGPSHAGRAHWSYRTRYLYYFFRNFPGGPGPIGPGNEHDIATDGPALLWWMTSLVSGEWLGSQYFIGHGSTAAWSVYPRCGKTELPPWLGF